MISPDPGLYSVVGLVIFAGCGLLIVYTIFKFVCVIRSMSRDDDISYVSLNHYDPGCPAGYITQQRGLAGRIASLSGKPGMDRKSSY
jgi:hypothetical protein